MLRVKNEARWIGRVLASIVPLCERTFIFDDHSTDDTVEICRSNGAVVIRSEFAGLDETRDKNFLLSHVEQVEPDWVVHIDGDEILEPGGQQKILAALDPGVANYSLQIKYLWNDDRHVRVDGVYGRFRRGSIFRMQPGRRFFSTRNGGNFHCGNVPRGIDGRDAKLDASLLHLGYMLREDRIRKYRWYNECDPGNVVEDCYRHVVQGDLPEVPAGARLRHAGPLEVVAI